MNGVIWAQPVADLLSKDYNEYSAGSILSMRRNTIIAACLDAANLMEPQFQ